MKVVVNKCFGGFGISIEALKELVIKNSDCVESFSPKYYYGGESQTNKREDWETNWRNDFDDYKDIGNGLKAHKWGYNIYKDGMLYQLKDRYESSVRTNKDLIEVIEKLGEKSFGDHSLLKIVEIPDGIDFEIQDYDGSETIHETHRSW